MTKRIQVKVDNIPQFIVSTRFVCQFNIEGRVKQVNAQLLGDTIYCEGLEFAYQTNQMNITTAFAVIWDGGKPLDNPENIHGKHYNLSSSFSFSPFHFHLFIFSYFQSLKTQHQIIFLLINYSLI